NRRRHERSRQLGSGAQTTPFPSAARPCERDDQTGSSSNRSGDQGLSDPPMPPAPPRYAQRGEECASHVRLTLRQRSELQIFRRNADDISSVPSLPRHCVNVASPAGSGGSCQRSLNIRPMNAAATTATSGGRANVTSRSAVIG